MPKLDAMLREPLSDSDTPARPSTREGVNERGGSSALCTPLKSTLKTRSLSDSTPTLAPSPTLKERKQTTQDDHSVPLMPNTPRRPDPPVGLHLQVPRREIGHASPIAVGLRSPLSPQLDGRSPYGSPTVLPRHSRGMDFSRAVTNLHHSTLADQSSPDSSPALAQRAMMVSRRQSVNSMLIDSPRFGDRRPGSGSVNMLGSEDSSSDDDLEPMEPDEHDPILATPKMQRESPSLSMGGTTPASLWPNPFPHGGSNFTGFRRARLREERGRHSSSSASGSNVASPAPASPKSPMSCASRLATTVATRLDYLGLARQPSSGAPFPGGAICW
jgi:hypothetical protein